MKNFWGCLRVLGLSLGTLGLVIALTLHQAEARFVESLRGFADELAKVQNLSVHTAPRVLNVNGLELHLVTATTHLGVTEALNRFQSACRGVGQIDLPATVRQKLEAEQDGPNAVPSGVLRQDADLEGFLACLDVGEGLDGPRFLDRLSEFGRTHNLRSLGQLRYALARRSGDQTTLLMFWTEGDAKLSEMFPRVGDVAGRDLAAIPRPLTARRILSAFEQDMPYGLVTYAVKAHSPRAALDAFDAQLRAAGWKTQSTRPGALLAEKSGRRVFAEARLGREKQVTITILDLG